MIRKLRRKFVWIAMGSVFLVLLCIVCAINLVNYHGVLQNADLRLDILEENGGEFPKEDFEPHGKKTGDPFLSPEAPFDTRYFTVLLSEKGSVIQVNTGRIAAVSKQAAADYAGSLFEKGDAEGFWGRYKYRAVQQNDGMVMYIFLDCGRELDSFYRFLWVSLGISLAGLLLVFVLVLFFSRLAIKPVAESYEKQRQFITDASHELKTPLTIINANAEVLEMEQGRGPWTDSIKKQTRRLSDLTEKLVYLSRMEEGGSALRMTEFSLSEAVSEAAEPYLVVAESRGKTLKLEIAQGISYRGSPEAIQKLVGILLDNAVRYSSPDGQIRLELSMAGKNRELSLWNPVENIQKGQLNMLFDRFFRQDASRNSQTGGHGIGLAVAKAIVQAHKGRITARSEGGKSILFQVLL